MSLDSLDTFLTTDKNDVRVCPEHGYDVPCRICQAEAADRAHDSLKED